MKKRSSLRRSSVRFRYRLSVGWTAARNELSQGAWVLFGIVFLWRLPHFLAIAWIYRADAKAGFPMLPVIDPDSRSTARQSVVYAAALLPLSLAPTLTGMAGNVLRRRAGADAALSSVSRCDSPPPRDPGRPPPVLRLDHLLPLLWILMIADRL